MEDIVIIGAGGFAREVAFLIEEINKDTLTYNLLGFVDKTSDSVDQAVGKHKIIGDDEWLIDKKMSAVLGTGSPQINSRIITKFGELGNIKFPNIIHPDTIWDKDKIKMQRGNIVCAGNIFTTDIEIGSFNIFNLSSTYGHDVRIQDASVFSPGSNISGAVTIGTGCLIGTGAKILPHISIGDGATVGAGAVVIEDVDENCIVVGVPAKPMKPKKR